MRVYRKDLQKALDDFLVAEVQEYRGIPRVDEAWLNFREKLAAYLLQDPEEEVKALAHTGFIFGMELAMRVVRNCGETYFNGKKPDELMLEGIIAMVRIIQVEIGSGRMRIPKFSEEEIAEVKRIS